ncbi:hypothetical protein K469DRAFT_717664 [Zopfia rhizophila CBS 207.26]|uniref:Uncharacterized protein n=1 Tax=Zopfia rhizophila CBS 207.26 TaxID=1314779 RepID=A0A6A6DJQ3_9PEZI|nr:hypothetical protein K469DRAFT_717664 [Zopfia rhizophila CBS 207.26]
MARFSLKMLSSLVVDWTGALGEVIIRDPHRMSRPKDGSTVSSKGRRERRSLMQAQCI